VRLVNARRFLFVIVFLNLATFGYTQAPNGQDAQIQSRQIQRESSPELREIAKFDEEEDDDFGELVILKKSKPWWITPRASVRGFWTSNTLLANKGEKGDSIYAQSQGFDAGYRITKDLRIQAGYDYQLTRYSENPSLDTDSHGIDFSASWQIPWDILIQTGANGLWLNSPQQNAEIYRENNPYFGISQSWGFLDGNLTLFYGLQYDRRFANPVTFDRNDYSGYTGLAYAWLPELLTQAMVRQSYQLYDFRTSAQLVNGRQEHVSTAAVQTVWQPLKWLQVSAFGILTYDNSINATRDYKVANLGGEIKAFWKF
jgi:hypothetical protein